MYLIYTIFGSKNTINKPSMEEIVGNKAKGQILKRVF